MISQKTRDELLKTAGRLEKEAANIVINADYWESQRVLAGELMRRVAEYRFLAGTES